MLQVEVIGNLGSDAEIKEFGGKKYVSMNIAHSDYAKDAQGNKSEQTIWVSALWYGDGGSLLQYLKKGCKVFVRGRERVKLYADKNGNAQFAINVNASEVQLCGIKGETNNAQGGSIPMQQSQAAPSSTSDGNDDLPF
ncbi:MAG: single-stranded DNA-binding protein [Alphaproteobacteria bacterium]|nr:single-stranded DNA-binding protein [Alphaproteobacteria bacterium]